MADDEHRAEIEADREHEAVALAIQAVMPNTPGQLASVAIEALDRVRDARAHEVREEGRAAVRLLQRNAACADCGTAARSPQGEAPMQSDDQIEEPMDYSPIRSPQGEAHGQPCAWCGGEGAIRDAEGKLGEDCPRCKGRSRLDDREDDRDG